MLVGDNMKIGIGLCGLGAALGALGVMLMFDRVLLSMANISFIMGMTALIGPSKTMRFFLMPKKLKGSIVYFTGFLVIVYGFSFIGLTLQCLGLWMLFATFLPQVISSLKGTSFGFVFELPGMKQITERIYDQRELPI